MTRSNSRHQYKTLPCRRVDCLSWALKLEGRWNTPRLPGHRCILRCAASELIDMFYIALVVHRLVLRAGCSLVLYLENQARLPVAIPVQPGEFRQLLPVFLNLLCFPPFRVELLVSLLLSVLRLLLLLLPWYYFSGFSYLWDMLSAHHG